MSKRHWPETEGGWEQYFERERKKTMENILARNKAQIDAELERQAHEQKLRRQDRNPAITPAGKPNLHPLSLFIAGVACFSPLLPIKIAGPILGCCLLWWLLILPIALVLSGGDMWDATWAADGDHDQPPTHLQTSSSHIQKRDCAPVPRGRRPLSSNRIAAGSPGAHGAHPGLQ